MPRLLIVCHPDDPFESSSYLARAMVAHWARAGIEVLVQRGWDRAPDADLVLPHVDLSVLPQPMRALLDRYPNVINRRVIDIRKRRISSNLLGRDAHWDGKVIVKTDDNYGGIVERTRASHAGLAARLHQSLRNRLLPPRPAHAGNYEVFESLAAVPHAVWRDRTLVVERFLPEREGDRYVIRHFFRLGDAHCVRRMWATDPLVKAGHGESGEELDDRPPPAEIVAAADRLGLDYGKLDYTMHAGRAVLLDVARTPAPPTLITSQAVVAHLAAGVHALLRRRSDRAA